MDQYRDSTCCTYTYNYYRKNHFQKDKEINRKKDNIDYDLKKGHRLFIASYLEMLQEKEPNKLFYPDANSTIRLSYGVVDGYSADNKDFKYYTNIDGYMAKEDANNPEFVVSDKFSPTGRLSALFCLNALTGICCF